jgi:putative DNA primase/helicase
MTTVTRIEALERLKPGVQWVCFNKEKVPFSPTTGDAAKADDPSTWNTFQAASKAWKDHPDTYVGIGREFLKEQRITGIDLDHCIDEQGTISAFAQDAVKSFHSYTELSPSGTGLHIWVYGNIPKNIGPHESDGDDRLEMYDCKRYFTVTGNHLPGTPTTIEDRQEELLALHSEIVARRQAAKQNTLSKSPSIVTQGYGGDTPYGLAALEAERMALASTGEGGRNQQLNNSAYSLGQLIAGNELTRFTVESELRRAARQIGLDDREIEKTLRSGIDKGMDSPRSAPIRDTDPLLRAATSTSTGNGGKRTNTSGQVGTAQVDPRYVLDCLYQGEWGDSLLFAHLFNGHAVYDHTEKEWYLWHKHAWARDETGRVKHLVSGHLASVYLVAAAEIVKEAKLTEDQEQQQKLNKKVSTLSQRALELRSVARSRNVLYFAASHDGMGIAAKQWDTNKWLLAVPNGVIDLKTGQCRDGKAEDYIRTISPTEWLGLDTPCPRFEQFLQEIFEDRAPHEQLLIIQFIQRLFGYAITGETIEHIFAVFYGEDGRNGKDTLQRAISHALGQVSGVISKDVLLDTGRTHNAGSATPHLSDLQGKRIAWANEPEKGARFSTGQVKDLSGGGDITTRSPYEKRFYTFTPSHFLILLTNHKPRAHADDSAFWDRLRLITFHMRFVDKPSEPNERKKDTILWSTLELEAPGILAWLVRGCLQWQAQGIDTPICITQDAQEYRKEEDMLSLFIDECCVIGLGKTARASQIFKAYSDWCKSGGLEANTMNRTQFGKLLTKKFPKKEKSTGFEYQGIGLVDSSGGFESNYPQPLITDEKPVDEDEKLASSGYYGYSLQENTKLPIVDTQNSKVTVKTIHTIHSQDSQDGVNEHGKPIDGTFETIHNYPSTIHASVPLDERGFPRFCFCGAPKVGITGGQARCDQHWTVRP